MKKANTRHIAAVTVTTKKGEEQRTRWLIWLDRVYPCIKGHSAGGLNWENTESLFPRYGSEARGLALRYSAAMLRSDYDEESAQDNRLDYAGADGAPGSLVIRGEDLGELSAEIIGASGTCGGYVSYRARGYNSPTPGEKNLLQEQVTPALLAYVKANARSLKAEAVAVVKAHFAEELREARERLNWLKVEAKKAKF